MGQLTKPAPKLDLQSADPESVEAAWANFMDAQSRALAFIQSQDQFNSDPQSRAEGYQSLLQNMVKAIEVSGLQEADAPIFTRIADLNAKSGMDNPDNEYRYAVISDEGQYRITGQLSSDRMIYFQSMVGEPGVGPAGPGIITDTLGPNRLVLDDDGRFEIIVSQSPPENADNWLRIEKGAEIIIVRFTDQNWKQLHAQDWLYIERLCETCPKSSRPMTDADIARKINRAAQSFHDRTVMWTQIANRIWTAVPRNSVGRFRETKNGLKGQFSAFGTFALAPDDALIVTVAASDADYQGIQLASRWFVSLDYRTRISSLTRRQAKADTDGAVRYVITQNDPGVWNWLDTSGHKEGLIMIRWQGIAGKPDPTPTAKLVKVKDLKDHLPESTVMISEDERKAQIKRRMRSVDLRFQ